MALIPEKPSTSTTRQVLEKIIDICIAHPFKPDFDVFLMSQKMAVDRALRDLQTRDNALIRTALYNVKVRKESNGEERLVIMGIELPEFTREIKSLYQEFQKYALVLKQKLEEEGIPYRGE
jgi:hypothetical protein